MEICDRGVIEFTNIFDYKRGILRKGDEDTLNFRH